MDGRRALGWAFVTFGALGLAAGMGAVAFGQLDELDQQAQANPQPDRTERNERLQLLGFVAAVPSAGLLALGAASVWPPDDRRARRAGWMTAAFAAAAILIVGFAVAPAMESGRVEQPLQVDLRDGNLAQTIDLGPLGSAALGPEDPEHIFLAPSNAGHIVAEIEWTAGAARENLIVTVDVDRGTGWQQAARAAGPSPLHLEAWPEDFGNASVRVTVEAPEIPGAADEQPFSVRVEFWR